MLRQLSPARRRRSRSGLVFSVSKATGSLGRITAGWAEGILSPGNSPTQAHL